MVPQSHVAHVPRIRGGLYQRTGDRPVVVGDICREALAAVREWGHEAILIAREAGVLAPGDSRAKGDAFDLVTRVDEAIEKMISARIEARFSEHALVGEEGSRRVGASRWSWLIDPIDGTFNFATGLSGAACSVALKEGDEVCVGAVVDFDTQTVFSAARGAGILADPSGHRLQLAEPDPSSLARVFLEFGTERFSADVGHALADLASVRPIVPRMIGSAAVSLLAIALRGGCFIGVGVRDWDVAAGVLLAEEAGYVTRWWRDDQPTLHLVVGPQTDVEGFSHPVEGMIEAWRRTAIEVNAAIQVTS